jgi:hypothetical protein
MGLFGLALHLERLRIAPNVNLEDKKMKTPQIKAPASDYLKAFEKALASGRLSHDVNPLNYVGDYMYMGFNEDLGRDMFKNRNTRKYIA